MKKNITVIFDMDGTIANLYGVKNWLSDLRNYNTRPYVKAGLMVTGVGNAISNLISKGVEVKIVSWLSKESTPEYDSRVRCAKREWLANNGIKVNSVRCIPYGTEKAYYRNKNNINILIDDNAEVRASFERFPDCIAIDPAMVDMVEYLANLVA